MEADNGACRFLQTNDSLDEREPVNDYPDCRCGLDIVMCKPRNGLCQVFIKNLTWSVSPFPEGKSCMGVCSNKEGME